uniref:G_PROTEIN_RECEP_F1_2 domain-containing protein n=1 Tax=Rhabditophanes sp. KR3021 TaxID=114890 RepID=A0AC35UD30_9BILA
MHCIPCKNYDFFARLLKYSMLLESLVPFLMGIMAQVQQIDGVSVAAFSGICYKLNNPLCAKVSIALCVVLLNFTVGNLGIVALMRFNVFVRKTKATKLGIQDCFFFLNCYIIGPVAILATLNNHTNLDNHFIPANSYVC